jgi:hypothetical protein
MIGSDMNDSSKLDEFKFLSTDLDSFDFPSVSRVGDMARAALKDINPKVVTEDAVSELVSGIEVMLDNYFSEEKYLVIEKIKEAGRYDLLESDDEGVFWDLLPHAEDEFSWNGEDNTTECYALLSALEKFHDERSDYPRFKYLAVLALKNIALWWSFVNFETTPQGERQKRTTNLSEKDHLLITEVLVDAMEAACNSTMLLMSYWRDQSYAKEKDATLRKQLQDTEKNNEKKIDEAVLAALEKGRKKTNEDLNAARWADRNVIKEWLCNDWFPRRSNFKSQTDAAEYYITQIAQKFGRPYKVRTIISWISDSGKEKGVRFK